MARAEDSIVGPGLTLNNLGMKKIISIFLFSLFCVSLIGQSIFKKKYFVKSNGFIKIDNVKIYGFDPDTTFTGADNQNLSTQLAIKTYVDNTIAANSGHWDKVGNDLNYMDGSVGIGTTTPDHRLVVIDSAIIDGVEITRGGPGNLNLYYGAPSGGALSPNVFLGDNSGRSATGSQNTGVGRQALSALTTGSGYVAMGLQAGYLSKGGVDNLFFGNFTGYSNANGIRNTFVGSTAGANNLGNNSIFLGWRAGQFETGSNKLIISAMFPSDEQNGRDEAIIYGEMAEATAGQNLYFNAELFNPLYGLGNFTGTPTTFSAWDVNGKVIERTPAQLLSDIGGDLWTENVNGIHNVSGNVGIGTTIPASPLHVSHNGTNKTNTTKLTPDGADITYTNTSTGELSNIEARANYLYLKSEIPGGERGSFQINDNSVQIVNDNLSNSNQGILNVFTSSVQLQVTDGTTTGQVAVSDEDITLSATAGHIYLNGSLKHETGYKTATYTVVKGDNTVVADGTFTVNLDASPEDGQAHRIGNIGTGTVTVDGDGGDLVGTTTTVTVAEGKFIIVQWSADYLGWLLND